MDPITRAAKDFFTECEAFWRRKHGRVLPVIAQYSQRKNLIAALRLQELAPENRWPVFLWDAPFEEPDSYFDGLTAAVEKQYDLIREGVAEEGITLEALTTSNLSDSPALTPMHRAVLCIRRVAVLLSELLDGVLVALVPEQFADRDMWRNTVEAWANLPWPDNVRLAVFDAPGGPLGGILGRKGAHFVVDEGILNDNVRNLSPPNRDSGGGNGGNGASPPVLDGNGANGACMNGARTLVLPHPATAENGTNGVRTLVLHDQPAIHGCGTNGVRTLVLRDRPEIERGDTNGVRTLVLHDPPIASGAVLAANGTPTLARPGQEALENAGRTLRALVVDAALKSREGEHFAAAQLFQQARTLCQVEGLTVQEAIVTVALAGACLAAGQADLAVKAFAMAADLGHGSGDWTVTTQAWLGAGGAYTMQNQHDLAARAYQAAGNTAEQAGSPVLQLEALRLLGACHLAAGSEFNAVMAWDTAVQLGAVQDPEFRKTGTFRKTAQALRDLLSRRGLRVQAAQVAARCGSQP